MRHLLLQLSAVLCGLSLATSRASLDPVIPFSASRHSGEATSQSELRLIEIGSDSTAFDVTATVVVGPTEAVLWDAMFLAPDAERLADTIQASGKRLKAIVLSHPDEDHISGAAVLLRRFPGTPVYMTPSALTRFSATARNRFTADKARLGSRLADSLITPSALPTNHLTVDGHAVEVIPDLTGDMGAPMNSVLWIPSLRAVLAADLVFNGVHPWLGASDSASRVAWRESLKTVSSLDPLIVVAGHKKSITLPDSPDVLRRMDAYLGDFETLVQRSRTPMELRSAILDKYPSLGVPSLVGPGAMHALQGKVSAAGAQQAPNTHASGTAAGSGSLATGKWTGLITPPGSMTLPATFDVGRGADGTTIVITVTDHGTSAATNVKMDANTLSFDFQPGPVLSCALKREGDGSYTGTCGADGMTGTIVMKPPT